MAEMEIITINIDGRSIPVKKDSTILEAARENNIYIPALCNSELVEPYAACRLCIVEVDDGRKTKLVTSCNYPVRKPIKVFTSSDKVLRNRSITLEMMLSRWPNVQIIKDLAKKCYVKI